MEMRLPRSVVEIIDRLESLGYEAYAVGGCVRDTLLGREPEDWDITTSAKPEVVKKRLTGRLIRASSTVPLLL